MVVVPTPTEVTDPDELMVAVDVLVLLQVPPVTASDNNVVPPMHMPVTPVIFPRGFTTSEVVTMHEPTA
jgi:hypothetical protein